MPEYIVLSTVPMESLEELIRCKDCKYSYEGFKTYVCVRALHEFTTEQNGFCAWAKRKEE